MLINPTVTESPPDLSAPAIQFFILNTMNLIFDIRRVKPAVYISIIINKYYYYYY